MFKFSILTRNAIFISITFLRFVSLSFIQTCNPFTQKDKSTNHFLYNQNLHEMHYFLLLFVLKIAGSTQTAFCDYFLDISFTKLIQNKIVTKNINNLFSLYNLFLSQLLPKCLLCCLKNN